MEKTHKLLVRPGLHDKGAEEVVAMQEKVEEENRAVRIGGGCEGFTQFSEGNARRHDIPFAPDSLL